MLIVADENIPLVHEAFSSLGEVRLLHGRAITPDALRDATILLVRSITHVNASLLEGSSVRFVATATSGTDHVDHDYLRNAGIKFVCTPGSNANSVAEYAITALLFLAKRDGFPLEGRRLGIVGVGHIGSRVEQKARALGMAVVLNDPPLYEATHDAKYRPLEELLDCDALTFHVPLKKMGAHPTYHLIGERFLRELRPNTILVNTCRGAVIDNAALLDALEHGRIGPTVLDVWEGEPIINVELLQRTALCSPHIGGYSFDGKVNGTEWIYQAACRFLNRKPEWDRASCMPPPDFPEIVLPGGIENPEDVVKDIALQVYPIERDDAALREAMAMPQEQRETAYDRLRKDYPRRREFQNTTVRYPSCETLAAQLREKLTGIGFQVSPLD
jgi:erythronate-4-phosphate dehydrogenase